MISLIFILGYKNDAMEMLFLVGCLLQKQADQDINVRKRVKP